MVTSDDRQIKAGEDKLFPSFAALKIEHSELLQRDPEGEDKDVYIADVQRFFARGLASGARIRSAEDRRASQSILNYWVTVLTRADRKPDKTTLTEFDYKRSPDTANLQSPYPGTRAFREEEGQLFFGRQRQIEYILGRLRVENFLAIIGPPGGGKSSLLRAGILPALKKDEQQSGKLFLPVVVPGSRPLSNLARVLKESGLQPDGGLDLAQTLRDPRGRLANVVEGKADAGVVLMVDQFEEVFTLCKDRGEREAFVESLLGLVRRPEDGHVVILSAQGGDFRDEMKRLPELEALFEPGRIQLPKLGLSELSSAITKPAELIGLKIAEGTVKNIVQEIAGEPVGLPLLQYTLLRLWEKQRKGDEISVNACAEVGYCRGALAAGAEEFYTGCADENERRTVKRMLVLLATRDDDRPEEMRRPVRADALLRLGKSREYGESVLRKMQEARLVRASEATTSADAQFELAHGSLRRSWPRMQGWLEADRKQSRNYKIAGVFAGALLVMLIGFLVWSNLLDWKERRRRSDMAAMLVTRSVAELSDNHLDLAMLLSLHAWELDGGSVPARASLLAALQNAPRPRLFLKRDATNAPHSVSLSPDGKLMAVDAGNSEVELWDVDKGEALGGRLPSLMPAKTVIFSPGADDRKVAMFSATDQISVWSLADRKQLAQLPTGDEVVVVFSPDGKTLAVGMSEKIILWDFIANSRRELKLPPRKPSSITAAVTSLDFNTDGKILASGLEDGRVILWDVALARPKGPVLARSQNPSARAQSEEDTEADRTIYSVSFSPDDNMLAAGVLDTVILWDVKDGKPRDVSDAKVPSEQSGHYVVFGGDNRTLTSFTPLGKIYTWDSASGEDREQRWAGRQLYARVDLTFDGYYSEDGRTLVTSGKGGVMVWDVSVNRPLLELQSGVTSLAFGAEGKALAMGGKVSLQQGGSVLWDIDRGRRVGDLVSFREVRSVALNADGSVMASGLQDGSIHLFEIAGDRDLVEPLPAVSEPVTSVVTSLAFHPDNKRLVALSVSDDPPRLGSAVTVWDFAGRRQVVNIRPDSGDLFRSILLSPDGTTVDIGSQPDQFTSMALSPDGTTVAVGSQLGVITLWGIDGVKIKFLPGKHSAWIRCLAFSPDGAVLASGDDDGNIKLWDVKNQTSRPVELERQDGRVSSLAFSPDGKTLAAGVNPKRGSDDLDESDDKQSSPGSTSIESQEQAQRGGVIVLWYMTGDRDPAKVMKRIGEPLTGHEGDVSSLAFSRGRPVLASGSSDGTVVFWNVDLNSAREEIRGIVRRGLTAEELRVYAYEDSGSTGSAW